MSHDRLVDLIGLPVVDATGAYLGHLARIVLDGDSDQPLLVVLDDPPLVVPWTGAALDGDRLRLPWPLTRILGAPAVDLSSDELDARDERLLREHFGLSTSLVRHEEHLAASAVVVATRRARLRRYVETEMVTITVPVRTERVVLETYELTPSEQHSAVEADAFDSADGRSLVEMIRHEERVVVTTEVVPVERLTLTKEVVVEGQRLLGEVRVEHVDVDMVAPPRHLPRPSDP